MIDLGLLVRDSISFTSIFVSLPLPSRSVTAVGVSSINRPLYCRPFFVSITQTMYWSAMALLGYRIDSNRFSRLAFLPIIDRKARDRKSTRLNSSHVAISYAV